MLAREALERFRQLETSNLYDLAKSCGVSIALNGKKNKGWVGQTLESVLGLTSKNLQRPDGEDFELKSTTLLNRNGLWVPKETIKVTQLNPSKIINEIFETSALWRKLSKMIFIGVYHESERVCRAVKVASIDIQNPKLVSEIRTFWCDVQNLVLSGEMKDYTNLGTSESLVQLRPTGDGKYFSTCPITGEKYPARAFYATKKLISQL